jgi:hypothetical protein
MITFESFAIPPFTARVLSSADVSDETNRRQRGHLAPPVSASYIGDTLLGLSVHAGSSQYPAQ